MVEKNNLPVVWSKSAGAQLEKAYKKIKEDSLQSAEKVRSEILQKASDICKDPERYPLDKYRKNNDGSIRAFEKQSYRIAYQVTVKQIRIIRMRSTYRLPLKY